MALTFCIKWYVNTTFTKALKEQSISYNHLSTSPTFFNNALWAGMAYDDSSMVMGEFSILQKDKWIDFVKFRRNLHLEKEFMSRELETLKWFSQGMYFLEKKDSQTLTVYITKWGRADYRKTHPKEAFVFYYEIRKEHGKFKLIAVQPSFTRDDFSKALSQLWHRIWSK
jgi:inner membrane protein